MRNTERETLIEIEIENDIYNTDLCIIGCSLLIGYIILSIGPLILDILFGFSNIINCNILQKPLIDIFIWMRVNGIISLSTLIMLIIIRKEVFDKHGLNYKIVRTLGLVINGFLLIWTGIGMTSFFMNYDIYDNYYIMLRMAMAPLFSILKLLEIYYS
jgi:hypothetical protein